VSTTVLLLDADGPAGARLAGRLSLDGYAAALARSVAHAEVIARRGPIDVLVLCDAGSAVAAVNLVRGVRSAATALAPTVGIVVVTAPEHAVAALEAGADDAVAGSVEYGELRARIAGIARRLHGPHGARRRVGSLEVDLDARQVTVAGTVLPLRRLEFELLAALVAAPDRVVPRAELMRALWGGLVHSRTLDAHASRLRMRLARAGAPGLVVASRGVGYRLH